MKKTKGFRSKVFLACGNDPLREAMSHVEFKDGFMVATDAHVLIKQDLSLHDFSEDEKKLMNGKYLHRDALKIAYSFHVVHARENGLECIKEGGLRIILPYAEADWRYPNYEYIVNNAVNDPKTPLQKIGINLAVADRLRQTMVSETKSVRFMFSAPNKAILVEDSIIPREMQLCLLMPTMIDN